MSFEEVPIYFYNGFGCGAEKCAETRNKWNIYGGHIHQPEKMAPNIVETSGPMKVSLNDMDVSDNCESSVKSTGMGLGEPYN